MAKEISIRVLPRHQFELGVGVGTRKSRIVLSAEDLSAFLSGAGALLEQGLPDQMYIQKERDS